MHLLLFGNSKWGEPATLGSIPTTDKLKSHDIFSCGDGTHAPGLLWCSFKRVTKLDRVVTFLTCVLEVLGFSLGQNIDYPEVFHSCTR
jgi:hypothetical protein